MKFIAKHVIFSLLTVSIVILLLEISLSILPIILPKVGTIMDPPWIPVKQAIPDSILGFKGNPAYFEHDRNGFRNIKLPRTAYVVALGDSLTYGEGVKISEAWPQQMEEILGRNVYNISLGGYGPAHSLMLWDRVMFLRPEIVIEALYFGNDFYDCYNLVYNKNQLVEFKTNNSDILEEIEKREAIETIEHKVEELLWMGHKKTEEIQTDRPLFLFGFLSKYSKLYGLLRRIRFEITNHNSPVKEASQEEQWMYARDYAEKHPQFFEIFNNGQLKTVFKSEYRLSAENLKDPRIREGLNIALRASERMNELALEQGIRFLVVLLPTKEFVFRNLVRDLSASYRELITNEEMSRNMIIEFLKENNIEYVDALPAMRNQLLIGIQPFHSTIDGHPNKFGESAIAGVVSKQLKTIPFNR